MASVLFRLLPNQSVHTAVVFMPKQETVCASHQFYIFLAECCNLLLHGRLARCEVVNLLQQLVNFVLQRFVEELSLLCTLLLCESVEIEIQVQGRRGPAFSHGMHQTHTHTHAHTHACTYTCTYTHTCTYIHMRTHIHTQQYTKNPISTCQTSLHTTARRAHTLLLLFLQCPVLVLQCTCHVAQLTVANHDVLLMIRVLAALRSSSSSSSSSPPSNLIIHKITLLTVIM